MIQKSLSLSENKELNYRKIIWLISLLAANNKRAFTGKDVAENLMDTYGIQLDVHRNYKNSERKVELQL